MENPKPISPSSSSKKKQAIESEAKVVLLGESGVGKTSLTLRFINEEFVENTLSTIGASFMVLLAYLPFLLVLKHLLHFFLILFTFFFIFFFSSPPSSSYHYYLPSSLSSSPNPSPPFSSFSYYCYYDSFFLFFLLLFVLFVLFLPHFLLIISLFSFVNVFYLSS